MHIILLSGGSGKRLWPLSNDIRSKQFIKIFKKTETAVTRNSATVRQNAENLPEKSLENVYIDDAYESMVQRVYRQIKTADSDATVTIATSKSQVSAIHNQLGNDVGISVEPCRRDTFPAIALATAYLHDVKGVPADEAVVVCPVDPYVNEDYFMALKQLWELAQQGTANLVLMGIQPTYPVKSMVTSCLLLQTGFPKFQHLKRNRTRRRRSSILSRVACGMAAFSLTRFLMYWNGRISYWTFQTMQIYSANMNQQLKFPLTMRWQNMSRILP